MSNSYEVKGLTFAYDKKEVLHGIDLTIKEGAITTLIGPNGCGKSTLFQVLTRNLKAEKGQILLQGQSLEKLKLKEIAKQVAIVHQYHTAPADITVEKLVAYGRLPHHEFGKMPDYKLDKEKVDWALEVTHTEAYRHQLLSALSGGQRQRVWIAMALAQDTKLLLLDEPTTYLDVRYQIQILKLIKELNETYGMTILMVLHDMNQAFHYSDQIVAMKAGNILASGSPEELLSESLLEQIYDVHLPVRRMDEDFFIMAI